MIVIDFFFHIFSENIIIGCQINVIVCKYFDLAINFLCWLSLICIVITYLDNYRLRILVLKYIQTYL